MVKLLAKDLRLGNFLAHSSGACKIVDMKEWGGKNPMVVSTPINPDMPLNTSFRELWDFQPIEITEEWLLKLGFKGENQFKYKGIILDFYLSRTGLVFRGLDIGNGWVKVYHVHQLQNLIFALKGEELTMTDHTVNG